MSDIPPQQVGIIANDELEDLANLLDDTLPADILQNFEPIASYHFRPSRDNNFSRSRQPLPVRLRIWNVSTGDIRESTWASMALYTGRAPVITITRETRRPDGSSIGKRQFQRHELEDLSVISPLDAFRGSPEGPARMKTAIKLIFLLCGHVTLNQLRRHGELTFKEQVASTLKTIVASRERVRSESAEDVSPDPRPDNRNFPLVHNRPADTDLDFTFNRWRFGNDAERAVPSVEIQQQIPENPRRNEPRDRLMPPPAAGRRQNLYHGTAFSVRQASPVSTIGRAEASIDHVARDILGRGRSLFGDDDDGPLVANRRSRNISAEEMEELRALRQKNDRSTATKSRLDELIERLHQHRAEVVRSQHEGMETFKNKYGLEEDMDLLRYLK